MGQEHSPWRTYNLSEVTERFRRKSPYGLKADLLELETRKYLFLCAQTAEPLAPSPLVDEYWHYLVLNTRTYVDYCTVSFDKFIHHEAGVPRSDDLRKEEHDLNYSRSLTHYQNVFGAPPKDIWPMPSAHDLPENYRKPHRIHIETTNHCNLRCNHCYPGSSLEEPHHPVEDIYKTLDAAETAGVQKITLTGGEFFTRKDWKAIVTRSLDICDNIYIITNGLLIDHKKLSWLVTQRVKRTVRNWLKGKSFSKAVEIGLAFSLDGFRSNGLTRVNAAGVPVDYTEVLGKIRLAAKYGLHLTVNTTLTNPESAKELPLMYDTLSEMGIDRWQIDNAFNAGRFILLGSKQPHWLENAKSGFEYIVKQYLKNFPALPQWRLEIVGVFRYDTLFTGFAPAASLDEHPCKYHFGSVIVEGGNEVRFCPSLRTLALGRIEQKPLQDIYENDTAFKEFLSKTIRDLPCRQCKYARIFHGGCRANSWSYGHDLYGRDPICCALSPFVEDRILPMLPSFLQNQFTQCLEGHLRPDKPGHPVYDAKAKSQLAERIS